MIKRGDLADHRTLCEKSFEDCSICGDGYCSGAENVDNCEFDCYCGDALCSVGETIENCPTDCAYCGDGICTEELGEATDCPEDCTVDDPCPADLDGDEQVAGSDLATLLSQWGRNGSADFNDDGVVSGPDLAELLGSWGLCTGNP